MWNNCLLSSLFFIHAISLSYFFQFFVSVTNLLLSQFAGQNISTRADGEDQQILSTHHRMGSSHSHATNGVAVPSGKRYCTRWTLKYSIYLHTHFTGRRWILHELYYQLCLHNVWLKISILYLCNVHYIIFTSTTRDIANEFEPCSKLEDLNLDVRKNSKETEENFLADNFFPRYFLNEVTTLILTFFSFWNSSMATFVKIGRHGFNFLSLGEGRKT